MLTKRENTIDGWKITEITGVDDDDIQEVTLNDLGWWLVGRKIANIYWKDGYYVYFSSGNISDVNAKTKTVFNYIRLDAVMYLKGKYYKYIEIDNETLETNFVATPKLNTAEKTHIPVFSFHTPFTKLILDILANKEKNSKETKI